MKERRNIVDIKELSNYLNTSVSTIRKMIYDNEIPFFKILAKYYFNLDIIDKWVISKHNDIEIGGFEDDIK